MSSLRLQRVRELLKRQIGEVIRRELPLSEVGMLTVNDVDVAKDLQSATVFVGFVGSEDQKKRSVEILQKERKRIQGLVARSVVLKYTPQLRFVMDDSVSRGNRILQILDEIERSSLPHEGPPQDH
ncbi:MAG: 30S ribosome-binding factor RbfA [Verrucomicrobia bacterium]|nr:30S ribosome-binding factor RbfA [Verrucomicrobiota bacterium]